MRSSKFTFTSGRLVRASMLVLMVVMISVYIIRQTTTGPYGTDTSMFLTGAHILTSGQGAGLYDLALETKVQSGLDKVAVSAFGVLPFNYPPWIAMFFSPLTLFALDKAYYIWLVAQWAILIGLATSIWSYFGKQHKVATQPLVMALFSFVPIFQAFLWGQMSIVLLGLWWWAFVSWREEKWSQLGVAIGLAAFKPQMTILLVVALVAQKRWRALGYVVATQAALWGLAMLLLGPQILLSYIEMLQVSSSSFGKFGFFDSLMMNFRGLLATGGIGPELSVRIALLFWALSIGATFWLWRKPWSVATRFGMTAVLAVLFSPHLYIHDASLLMIAVVCASVAYIEQGVSPDFRWIVVPLAALLVALYSPIYLRPLGITNYGVPLILATWLFGLGAFFWLVSSRERVGIERIEAAEVSYQP